MADSDQHQFAVQRVFLKDASFELPNAPAIFKDDLQPENNVTVNTKVTNLEKDTFEVVLTVNFTSKAADRTLFMAEVQQAGIFTVRGFPESERSRLLGAYCPHLLYAYASEVITNLVTKGSFPQVILQPINFDAVFNQHQQELSRRPTDVSGSNGKFLN